MTTAELIVIAAALQTAPIMLLYPPPYNEDTEILPGKCVRKFDAVQDFIGQVEPGVSSPEYAVSVYPLHRAAQIVSALRARDEFSNALKIDGIIPGEGDYREALERANDRLDRLNVDDGW